VFVSRLYARSSRKRANAPGLLRDGEDLDARQAGVGGAARRLQHHRGEGAAAVGALTAPLARPAPAGARLGTSGEFVCVELTKSPLVSDQSADDRPRPDNHRLLPLDALAAQCRERYGPNSSVAVPAVLGARGAGAASDERYDSSSTRSSGS
jgi:hypothetical protein